jgi:predicted nucleic acid-binding protein
MLKLYLDNCCYNRPFDDLRQEKNNLEAQAIKLIIDKYWKDEFEIYTSDALVIEMNNIKDQIKKAKVLEVYNKLNLINIPFSNNIIKRASELRQYNIKNMDSLHIAYAESSNIDYFITTDKLLINASSRANLNVKVINPISFIMEVI